MSDHDQGRPPMSPEIQEWIQRIREHSATLPDLDSPRWVRAVGRSAS
ncbi:MULTISPECIES: hypothetical protein [unclassified Microbacterium]|nr:MULTISPECIES: hypothetical protein [unclassified Microbacterium]QNA92175.1 hypothetical protein G4G29_06770 [Microbacterium sp. Se63.02b]QYM65439.1 hypothetical protein K1X59_06830 [Microbacterium sp. Se5.02b]